MSEVFRPAKSERIAQVAYRSRVFARAAGAWLTLADRTLQGKLCGRVARAGPGMDKAQEGLLEALILSEHGTSEGGSTERHPGGLREGQVGAPGDYAKSSGLEAGGVGHLHQAPDRDGHQVQAPARKTADDSDSGLGGLPGEVDSPLRQLMKQEKVWAVGVREAQHQAQKVAEDLNVEVAGRLLQASQ